MSEEPRDPADGPDLALVPPLLTEDEESLAPPTRVEMLAAIPGHVLLWGEVDLDDEDPAAVDDGRRVCIAARRAGGRCTATVARDSYLCNAHSGRLDPRAGGLALAQKRRDATDRAEREDAARRLGTRAVIAEVFHREAKKVEATIETLLAQAATGDRACALALIPYLNQGLGMPTERVALTSPSSEGDIAAMTTAELQDFIARKRAKTA